MHLLRLYILCTAIRDSWMLVVYYTRTYVNDLDRLNSIIFKMLVSYSHYLLLVIRSVSTFNGSNYLFIARLIELMLIFCLFLYTILYGHWIWNQPKTHSNSFYENQWLSLLLISFFFFFFGTILIFNMKILKPTKEWTEKGNRLDLIEWVRDE